MGVMQIRKQNPRMNSDYGPGVFNQTLTILTQGNEP